MRVYSDNITIINDNLFQVGDDKRGDHAIKKERM